MLTFRIHLITMVGQDIHGGAAIHAPKEPFLGLVWTHFESLVREAIVLNSANFSNMHVRACLHCTYVFFTRNFEMVAKH